MKVLLDEAEPALQKLAPDTGAYQNEVRVQESHVAKPIV
jgi:hypothetical protein